MLIESTRGKYMSKKLKKIDILFRCVYRIDITI